MIEKIGVISGTITALATAIYALRKFYFWLRPVVVEPSCHLILDGSQPDSMGARVTNRSQTTQYLRSCVVRGTFSLKFILLRHLRNPFLSPRLYQNIWYNGAVYELMDNAPIKLEPQQLIELKLDIYEHPLNAMYTPYFIVKATLTSGREILSTKMWAPACWRLIGMRGR